MNKYKEMGFTLIELLIVIALIGVLAVALLSTINPLEQTRKAKDSERRASAGEFLSAVERFQATFFCWPWEFTTGTTPPCDDTQTISGTVQANETALIQALVTDTNEMKPEFFDRDVTADLYVGEDAGNLVHVCFEAESRTFTQNASAPGDGEGCGTGAVCSCVPE